jgi:predicted TIM-barrel fold metal-dependent hydrolase
MATSFEDDSRSLATLELTSDEYALARDSLIDKDLCNVRRLMWASDFPHSDSTWPSSQDLLKKQAAHLTEEERDLVLHDNVAELYQFGAQ